MRALPGHGKQVMCENPGSTPGTRALGYFASHVKMVRSAGIQIDFLEEDEIRLAGLQKLDNPVETQSPFDIPVHDTE